MLDWKLLMVDQIVSLYDNFQAIEKKIFLSVPILAAQNNQLIRFCRTEEEKCQHHWQRYSTVTQKVLQVLT